MPVHLAVKADYRTGNPGGPKVVRGNRSCLEMINYAPQFLGNRVIWISLKVHFAKER